MDSSAVNSAMYSAMNIAILHYHLNRGGVTQVIANQLRALAAASGDDERWRIAILYGGRREAWSDALAAQLPQLEIVLQEVPTLEYGAIRSATGGEMAADVRKALATCGFSAADTLLHFHNHSLGKNVATPDCLAELAASGFRQLLQIHDFAEDFRPDNFRELMAGMHARSPRELAERLYPQASHIHYAVLNGRDYEVLRCAGVDDSRLHWLPNPVAGFGELPDHPTTRRRLAELAGIRQDVPFVLYPVRGIRRKNVGEMLLLSLLATEPLQLGVTLEPLNPLEKPSYETWKRLADARQLPCHFGLGRIEGVRFEDNLAASDAILTTSVAEGFGMVFLESWLAQRRLLGRNLPEITKDFVQSGVHFDNLYERIHIPVAWLGRERVTENLLQVYGHVLQAFGMQPVPAAEFAAALEDELMEDAIDFGRLPGQTQAAVIESLCDQPGRRDELRAINPGVVESLATIVSADQQLIVENAEAVRRNYSLTSAGQRLRRVYRQAFESDAAGQPHSAPHCERILESFLSLSRLNPIRFMQ